MSLNVSPNLPFSNLFSPTTCPFLLLRRPRPRWGHRGSASHKAGQAHALLSDGERVWGIGKVLDSTGKESTALSAPWSRPRELLCLAAEGVHSIACGAHSSAVVSGDGSLHMWGRLLEFHHAESLIKRHAASHAYDMLVPEDLRWRWAGFGADRPMLVEGISGVKGVALGGWHALVLVE